MRRAYLALPAALLLASTAHAADTIAQVAILTSGLADGAQTMIGGFGTGPVTMPEPGYYEATFDKGVVKFLFDEAETCHVTVHAEIPTQGGADLRYDLTKITSISVDDRGKFEGQNAALVTLEGDDVVQVDDERQLGHPARLRLPRRLADHRGLPGRRRRTAAHLLGLRSIAQKG